MKLWGSKLMTWAGYEYNKFAADGTTAFIFSTCYPNAFSIHLNNNSRKKRQAGGKSDAQFCQDYGNSEYSDFLGNVCSGSNYVGNSPGEFCSFLIEEFAELCNDYSSCETVGGSCQAKSQQSTTSEASTTTTQSTTTTPESTTEFFEIPGENCILPDHSTTVSTTVNSKNYDFTILTY